MIRQLTTSRLAFLSAGAAALALAFVATLASAPAADNASAAGGPLAVQPVLDAASPACTAAESDAELFITVPGDDESSDDMSPAAKPMRGYCRCTCSLVPNCSTNADCGGGLCLRGPTCC